MPRVLRLLPLFALSVAAAHLVGLGSVAAAGPTSPAPALRQCNEADDPVARLRGGCAHGFSAILEDAKTWNPILLAFIGTSFGWFMTALGSSAVIVHGLGLSEASYRKMLDFMLGISGGVMTAASYWSLLAPALEFAAEQGWNDASYVPVAIGFLSGGVLLQATDALLDYLKGSIEELDLYKGVATGDADDKQGGKGARVARVRRLLLLIIAITIHNFPEGMAVGVGFGAMGSSPGATIGGAISLALGIGIQNFPEGLAVSMPLMREGVSPLKAFWYGQLSGVVEPIGGVLGAAFVQYCRPLLPFTMSLAAGAMIFVVADSLIPEMTAHGNKALAIQGLMIGFVLMMVLDVALG